MNVIVYYRASIHDKRAGNWASTISQNLVTSFFFVLQVKVVIRAIGYLASVRRKALNFWRSNAFHHKMSTIREGIAREIDMTSVKYLLSVADVYVRDPNRPLDYQSRDNETY